MNVTLDSWDKITDEFKQILEKAVKEKLESKNDRV